MRLKSQKQLYLKPQSQTLSGSFHLKLIAKSLESLAGYDLILNKVSEDLNPQSAKGKQGRHGMTAEQVLRALIVKQLKGYSYRELSDAIKDSISVMEFLNMSPFLEGFSYVTGQIATSPVN